MEKEKLELRMYFLVPYNISPIQQAIQAGHAALEYARLYDTELFRDFVDNWKTWIILNGGTTNNNSENPGTLQQIRTALFEFNSDALDEVNFTTFKEPDLNDALTAICFICDERVFNYEKYPDLYDYLIDVLDYANVNRKSSYKEISELYPEWYKDWEKSLGGPKNVFLRNLLKGKKLA